MLILTTNKDQKKKTKQNSTSTDLVKTFFTIVSKRGFLTLLIFTRPVSGTKHQLQKVVLIPAKPFLLYFFHTKFQKPT